MRIKIERDISDRKYKISVRYYIKVLFRALVMSPLPIIAYKFEQMFPFWFSIAFIIMLSLMQLFHAWVMGEKDSPAEIDTIQYYGKGRLFTAISILLLIIGATSYALYIKLP